MGLGDDTEGLVQPGAVVFRAKLALETPQFAVGFIKVLRQVFPRPRNADAAPLAFALERLEYPTA